MNELTLNERQLATLKNTIAKPLTGGEFNLFVEYCRNVGLDPIRKQVVPILFSAGDAAKRQMTIVVTIDGLRTIAARVKDYRPDDQVPLIVYNDEIKNANTNPLGIEKAVVRVFKQDNRGEWYPVVAEAYWDEFAPVKTWDGVSKLDSKTLWPTKPRVMICKCAEAQALRKGWPDQFAGVYTDSEFDKAQATDAAASEVVETYLERERVKQIGGERAVTFLLDTGVGLERLPVGKIADRFLGAATKTKDLNEFATLMATNRDSLQEFWAFAPTDALGLKRELETIEDKHRAKEPVAA